MTDGEGTNASSTGLLAQGRRLLDQCLGVAQTRLELLSVELQEEKYRLVEVLILTFAVVVLALMALMVVSFALVVLFWDHGRMIVLVILVVAYTGAAVGVGLRLRRQLKSDRRPFRDSIDELKKDRECL